jgi:hypothetical protein
VFDRICNMSYYVTRVESICHEMFIGLPFVICLLEILTALKYFMHV